MTTTPATREEVVERLAEWCGQHLANGFMGLLDHWRLTLMPAEATDTLALLMASVSDGKINLQDGRDDYRQLVAASPYNQQRGGGT